MQTQNQQLLQQITERDDYNIKVINIFGLCYSDLSFFLPFPFAAYCHKVIGSFD